MPIYEYFCPVCRDRFELILPISKSVENALCPQCRSISGKILSSCYQHRSKSYLDKLNERKAEVEYKADRRMEEDKLLQPENWLAKVKKEREGEKAFKKEVERTFGKDPDAPLRYAVAVENEIRIKKEDPWAND